MRMPRTLEFRERLFEDADAMPPDEGAQQVDRVRGGEFAAELRAEDRFILGVGEKGGVGEWRRRAGERGGAEVVRSQREELLTIPGDGRLG